MNITIIGGGKLGENIALNLLKNERNSITIIEKDYEKSLDLSEKLEVNILNGDASEPIFLSSAGIEDTDIFIITTGKDEINFICTEIITKLFNYERLVVRVNNPKNRQIFEKTGAHTLVYATDVIANFILEDINPFLEEREEDDE